MMTRNELKAALTENNVEFPPRAQMKTLQQLYETEVLKVQYMYLILAHH